MGGHKAQGRERDTARQLFAGAIAVQAAGCFALVLEAVPPQVAAAISRRLAIPTIGIGSGAGTDGQVLVLHDMLGITRPTGPSRASSSTTPRSARRCGDAVRTYADEVRGDQYPAAEHAYTMPDEEVEAFERAIGAGSIEENVLADW